MYQSYQQIEERHRIASAQRARSHAVERGLADVWQEQPDVDTIRRTLRKDAMLYSSEEDVVAVEQLIEAKRLKNNFRFATTTGQARRAARHAIFTIVDTDYEIEQWIVCVQGLPWNGASIPFRLAVGASGTRRRQPLSESTRKSFQREIEARRDALDRGDI